VICEGRRRCWWMKGGVSGRGEGWRAQILPDAEVYSERNGMTEVLHQALRVSALGRHSSRYSSGCISSIAASLPADQSRRPG
jgi:hypothetical protein